MPICRGQGAGSVAYNTAPIAAVCLMDLVASCTLWCVHVRDQSLQVNLRAEQLRMGPHKTQHHAQLLVACFVGALGAA
jgi:hypothetical protein